MLLSVNCSLFSFAIHYCYKKVFKKNKKCSEFSRQDDRFALDALLIVKSRLPVGRFTEHISPIHNSG